MYEFEKKTSLVTIASPIDQNLALLDVDELVVAETLAVIHQSFVNVIPILNPKRRARYVSVANGEKRDIERICQVKWIKLKDDMFFATLSTIGLQIYDVLVNDVIYYHCCREGGDRMCYTVGACVIQNLLCIGTSLGAIWVFRPNVNNSNFSVIGKHYGHDDSILLLDGCDKYLVSCSETASYVWKMDQSDIEIIRQIQVPGLEEAPTAIKVCSSMIFIGYESGEFCIFDIIDEVTSIRSVGHRLKIVDIDFSPLKYKILTASLDAYLKIWNFNQATLEVICHYTLFNDLGPLCAGRFLNLNCTAFCTVTIGEIDVRFYKKVEENDQNRRQENKCVEELFKEKLLQND